MGEALRGCDIVARSLAAAGVETIFTLSGNHIMPIFDALLETDIKLIHVRHEAATVHMADAYARLTGKPGIALVTGGPGHTNAAAGLYTALGADAPIVLLSGHAGTNEIGRGGFQEIRQADMAAPVSKDSSTSSTAEGLGEDIADAIRTALSGRPGPVHLSLPSDLLDANVPDGAARVPNGASYTAVPEVLGAVAAQAALGALAEAKRPLILAGPALCTATGRDVIARLQQATGVPVLGMESPRGINDPSLGAFAEVMAQADRIMLLGKPLDFTLKFGGPPTVDAACTWVVVDPDAPLIDRAKTAMGNRLVLSALADPVSAATELCATATEPVGDRSWLNNVGDAVAYRPADWGTKVAETPNKLHPLELCRGLAPVFAKDPDAVLVADGGEIGQWAQCMLMPRRRVINGVAGSIGASLPFALAARVAEPNAPVIAVLGDGTVGFQLAEFETAVRHRLPFVAVVGNDARWNAEYQIQLREYGAQRTHSCELMEGTRYDQVVTALGGYGEVVERAADLPAALDRAIASGLPALLNVMTEGPPAPVVRRS